jgi:hypothetical protein
MTTQPNDGLLYLDMYPRLRKWMNQCAACQRLGHKPELPESLEKSMAAKNLRSYFPEMAIDESGLCEHCVANFNRARRDQ